MHLNVWVRLRRSLEIQPLLNFHHDHLGRKYVRLLPLGLTQLENIAEIREIKQSGTRGEDSSERRTQRHRLPSSLLPNHV